MSAPSWKELLKRQIREVPEPAKMPEPFGWHSAPTGWNGADSALKSQ
jgi:hypothetical protein